MIRPLAKQKGFTDRGNMYMLSQWAPNIIQLTLQKGDYVISETLENLRSEQEMVERRDMLENELIDWISQRETPHEATEQVLHIGGGTERGGEGMDTVDSTRI